MDDFLDFEFDHDFADLDGNGLPDLHERMFIRSGTSPLPDVINGSLDLDHDGTFDQYDNDLDNDGIPDLHGPDTDGDGIGDFIDPFVDNDGDGISDHAFVSQLRNIQLHNPFFRQ